MNLKKRQHEVIKRLVRSLNHWMGRRCAEGIEETKAALQYAQEIIEEYNESEKIHTTNLTGDWVCDWCSAFVPGGQYHDCKEGKLK